MKPSRRKRPYTPSGRTYAAVTLAMTALALFAAPSLGASRWVAAGAVLMLGLLSYVVLHPPPRHRRFGWGETQQAKDEYFGHFGGTYPEDRDGLHAKRQVGRNQRCPCGSGHKYKHCCGA